MTRAVLLACALLAACAPHATTPPAPRPPGVDASPQALYAQGVAWARRGDMVRAEQYIALAVRAGFPHERALVAIVEVCLVQFRLQAALAYAEPYLRRHPDAWQVRLLVATVCAALGRHERAAAELRQVTRDSEGAAEAHHQLAVLLDEELGDEAGARASFSAYLVHAPGGRHAAEARAWLAARGAASPSRRSKR